MMMRFFRVLCLVALPGALLAAPNVSTYPLGSTFVPTGDGGGVVFRVWAPNANAINVVGQFNGFNTTANPMTKDAATNYWSAWIPTAVLGQEYKYYITQAGGAKAYKIDPRSRKTRNTTGNAVIVDDGSRYNWQAGDWQTPDKNRMVIYELHIGTFSGSGDGVAHFPARYRDVVDEHLDDIKASGANMVELMPVHEFPGATSWGYNPVHFFAPETDYGSPDDLRYMIDTFHSNGIGVILDVVYNHTSNDDNNLWNFDGAANIYFFGNNCQGNTPYGSTRPKWTDSHVRDMIVDNARYWIREFRFDGLRIDSTQTIRGYCNEGSEAWLLIGDISDAIRSENPRAIAIAEELPNTAAITTSRGSGGAGYDSQWCDGFNDKFRQELVKYNSGGSPNMNVIEDAIANSGWGGPNLQAIKYVDSHDEAGNDTRITKVIDSTDGFSARAIGMGKVCGALTYLSPGIPMIFQGQEFLEDKKFGDASGQRIWWGFLGNYSGVRKMFGDIGAFRQTRGSLKADSGYQAISVNDTSDVIAFQRYDTAGDVTFVIANFSGTNFPSYLIGVPSAGTWHELVNSDATEYRGGGIINGSVEATNTSLNGQPARIDIKLPPYSVLVFSRSTGQTPTPTPSPSPTLSPSPTMSVSPTPSVTASPTASISPSPTISPTVSMTASPSITPTSAPQGSLEGWIVR
ncbi:alpha amylase C-terminal domain-containing protein [Candidatus Sumerlaeota bacterium]|nr:alpha amylase C-terminal domain-containing protein [Candidatus Sumerlaeota bacterium]